MAINTVVATDDLTVLGPPSTIELQVDIGPQGERGSYIYSGFNDPNTVTSIFVTNPQKIGDLYYRTSNNVFYQYLSQPGGDQWVEIGDLGVVVDDAQALYDQALALSASNIYWASSASAYANASASYLTYAAASAIYIPLTSQQSIINSASAAAVTYLVDSAPSTLDTLNELAAALGDDPNYATTITNALAAKLDSSTASATYLTQANASATYLTQASASGLYLTQSSASSNYFPLNVNINTQSASYTLELSDVGKIIEMNSASANNLTIPADSTTNFPVGTTFDIVQYGSGQTTVVASGGVTLRSKNGNTKLTSQYSGASLYKKSSDLWVLIGDLSA